MRLVRIQQHARQQKVKQRSAQRSERTPWTFFACVFFIQSHACAVFVLRRLEHKNLQKFCQHAPRNSRSPVPLSLQHRVLIHNSGVRSFLHAFDFIAAKIFAVHCTNLFRWAVQGCLLSPQNIVVLQVCWQGFFSSLPSLVLPVARPSMGFSRLSFL